MRKLMQTDFEEIKETNIQLPSSRREIEEDMLEQICLIANAGAEITVEELCGRMNIRFLYFFKISLHQFSHFDPT